MKGDGGLGVERHVDLTDGFVRVEVAIDATESHCFLRVRQLDADQFLGLMHHLLADAKRWCWRRARRRCWRWRRRLCENIRQLRGYETRGAKCGQALDEISSGDVCFIRSWGFSFFL